MKQIRNFLLVMVLAASPVVWTACHDKGSDDEGGMNHNVGMDCLQCHRSGGGGDGIFSVGGTVYIAGSNTGAAEATIRLFPDSGHSGTPVATITSAVTGNFMSESPIDFSNGLFPTVTSSKGTSSMAEPIYTGACNSCHGVSTGKITVQ
jgi:hypothetical protein